MATRVIHAARIFVSGSPIGRLILAMMLVSALAACGPARPAGTTVTPNAVTVSILYLDHAPVQAVLSDIDQVLARQGGQIVVQRYDAEKSDGVAFAKAHNITEHTPLAIFINGSMEYKLDGRLVKFYSFPQGQGTGLVPDGAWTIYDFEAALSQVTGNNT